MTYLPFQKHYENGQAIFFGGLCLFVIFLLSFPGTVSAQVSSKKDHKETMGEWIWRKSGGEPQVLKDKGKDDKSSTKDKVQRANAEANTDSDPKPAVIDEKAAVQEGLGQYSPAQGSKPGWIDEKGYVQDSLGLVGGVDTGKPEWIDEAAVVQESLGLVKEHLENPKPSFIDEAAYVNDSLDLIESAVGDSKPEFIDEQAYVQESLSLFADKLENPKPSFIDEAAYVKKSLALTEGALQEPKPAFIDEAAYVEKSLALTDDALADPKPAFIDEAGIVSKSLDTANRQNADDRPKTDEREMTQKAFELREEALSRAQILDDQQLLEEEGLDRFLDSPDPGVPGVVDASRLPAGSIPARVTSPSVTGLTPNLTNVHGVINSNVKNATGAAVGSSPVPGILNNLFN